MAGITECDDKAVTLGKDAGKQTEQGKKKKIQTLSHPAAAGHSCNPNN